MGNTYIDSLGAPSSYPPTGRICPDRSGRGGVVNAVWPGLRGAWEQRRRLHVRGRRFEYRVTPKVVQHFGDGILGPSTAFVKRNPEQTQRPLLPASGSRRRGRRHSRRLQSRRRHGAGVARHRGKGARPAAHRLGAGPLPSTPRRASHASTERVAESGVQHRSWSEGPRG